MKKRELRRLIERVVDGKLKEGTDEFGMFDFSNTSAEFDQCLEDLSNLIVSWANKWIPQLDEDEWEQIRTESAATVLESEL